MQQPGETRQEQQKCRHQDRGSAGSATGAGAGQFTSSQMINYNQAPVKVGQIYGSAVGVEQVGAEVPAPSVAATQYCFVKPSENKSLLIVNPISELN